VKIANIARILLLSLALSSYSAWSLAVRDRESKLSEQSNYSTVAGLPLIRIAEAEALWRQSSTIFLDVRPVADYEIGHIAGAVNLPDEEFEQRFPTLRPRLERAEAIVVYCKSVDCGKSLWSAIRLRNEGLMQTRIYPYGWNEWYLQGLPTSGAGR
jgi:rhodanese-related sulfurtransferase